MSRPVLLRLRWLLLSMQLLAGLALAGEPVSVQLIWKHQFEFAAFYAAEAKGYYRDAGLDVTIKEGGPGIDAVREVLAGQAEFAVGTSSLVVERYQGKPVVALAMLMQHSPIGLLASRAAGVSTVHDLAGRPIAVDPHSRDEIEAYLRASGIHGEQIRFVEQPDWTLDSLKRGEIAAKAVYISNEPFLIRDQEHEFLLLVPRSAGIDLFGNLLYTSEAVLKKRPEQVRAFREATLKGMVYALAHPEEVADLILARYNTQNKSREHLVFEAAQIRELTRPDIVEPGYMSPGRWRHVVEMYASRGKMPADFSLEGFLYDPAPATMPAWMKWAMGGALIAMLASWLLMAWIGRYNRILQREVRERREAEQALQASESKYRELIENANAVILRLAPDGTVSYFNEVAEQTFGFSAAEILNQPVLGRIVPAVESGSGRDLEALIAGILRDPARHAVGENENMTRDGRRLWLRWANQGIVDAAGNPLGVLCIGQDSTAQHHLEQELAQHRLDLEATVERRTEELRLAKEAAEAASRAKSTFLTNMSHELRTPFHGILGAIGLARSRMVDEKGRNMLDRARGATEHLLQVINDVLDISRIEADRLVLESIEFRLPPILKNLNALLEDRASAKGLAFRTELADGLSERRLLGDPTRLGQVLINLAANAVKFTERGSVTIRVGERHDAGRLPGLHFEVIDTGIGIGAADQARLFTAFEQADSSMTRKYGGTGLGLAICKRLVDMMGGEIGVRSAPGEGSTFWFEIPLPPGPEAHPEAETASGDVSLLRLQREYTGKRVLVAEDEPLNQEVARTMLLDAGLAVDVAADGAEAVRLAAEHAYDVILMDMQMPVMNGLEATVAIRSGQLNFDTPILAMTANAFAEDRQRCLAVGMHEHIVKPVTPEALYAILLRWLSISAGTTSSTASEKPGV